MKIIARPITVEGFKPYGQILRADGTGPVRIEHAAAIENRRADRASPNLSIVRYAPKVPPLQVSLWERHPHSTQSFLPLEVSRYLVLVCPARPDGAPDVSRIDAFIVPSGHGISYDANVWHHGMAPLDTFGVFANLIWQDGTPADCEFCRCEEVIEISIDGGHPVRPPSASRSSTGLVRNGDSEPMSSYRR